jgi:short-subunit dehydrogenase
VDVATESCGVDLVNGLAGISVDIMVYAAGTGWVGPLMNESEDTIRTTVATNITGCALVTK